MLRVSRFFLVISFVLLAVQAQALEYNMPVGVTSISRDTYWLHMVIFFATVGIGVIVFGAMFWSMYFHHRSRHKIPAKFHDNLYLEIGWTVAAALILVVMAWPATTVLMATHDTSASDLTVEARGYQWKWQYKYLDADNKTQVSFFSNLATPEGEIQGRERKGEYYLQEVDEPLVVPIDKKIRFLITSNDVLHAFWVPDFSIKADAIPGYVNELWTVIEKPGIYRGQCAELCGQNHGFMPIVVHAVDQNQYNTWYANRLVEQKKIEALTQKEWTAEQLFELGEQVYMKHCVACHQLNGQGLPPAFPSLVGMGLLADRQGHINAVYNGKAGTAMQAFGLQLGTVDLAAVIQYERHAWGNNSGDITTPLDILAFEKAQSQ